MSNDVATRNSPSPAAKAARYLAQAKQCANEQIELLVSEMSIVRAISQEIVDGGPIYPAGIRDLCERFVSELQAKTSGINQVTQSGRPAPAPTEA